MRILFTADLHLSPETQDHTLSEIREWLTGYRPDALVVAGDLSTAQNAEATLRNLRACYPTGQMAVCLGNHDFWVENALRRECGSLSDVIDRFWLPAAKAFDVTLLDNENLPLPGITIVGGYGHYDLGFAVPGLAYDGVAVTEEDYVRNGRAPGHALYWRDFSYLPNGRDLYQVAADQVAGIRRRLAEVSNSQVIVALHTPPFEALLGVPSGTQTLEDGNPHLRAFFRAYLGNRTMGDLLRTAFDKVVAVVCGHTHRPAGPLHLDGTETLGINIGADYAVPKAALYRTDLMEFERLPD